MSKTALVTGCSSGFGRDVAAKLARAGYRVYATMRGVRGKNATVAEQLQALAKAEKLDLRALELDVTSSSSVQAAAAKVLAESGAPDLVINNAGQMYVGFTEAYTEQELARQLDINVVGVHRVSRAFLPAMRKRGSGLVINISSVAGRLSLPFFGVYHASKWALEGYSQALRVELASSGVDVVVVEPGPFTTNLFPASVPPEDADGRAKSYPAATHEGFAAMQKAFEATFADASMPTDPALVVDRLVELAQMLPGTRPFRSVVGIDFGVVGLNDAAAPHHQGLVNALGLGSMANLTTRG